ncbi:RagB/SusD family nutrient uptake outer membrane protein [Aestuariibaculum suncheonense]|uniref:RagB/SusD family nutrient uptake outer membrane protein n=1 Tax=Aestuariibaculum suncheonense TaxID=1028745 RepID=A0A8J6QJL7_9FLAO|nr:RagB/SusD family nutrient uptake outer membrane protein [Aestuariibaculum suncheonense]MBD0836076.1 RagB/SusD family nutrient uptake outer membrane protein [Aestuariibaculum suncheonense]
MKKIIHKILLLNILVLVFSATSCEDYLDEVPKGQKIPETLADFEAMLRYEYGNHRVDINQALNLLNDTWVSSFNLSYYPLYKANYMWDEAANRIELNNSDETTYYASYSGINAFNLIIENALTASEATEDEKNEVWAQAKVLRAMTYFNLLNFYADTYDETTASTKLSVPLITSADVNAPYTQVSIQNMYDFILKDLQEALPYLPQETVTALHPSIGTAYAFYARVYLQMNNFSKALEFANKALVENDQLYDWTAYYEANKAQIENPDSYIQTTSPLDFNYVENYSFRHGSIYYQSGESSLTVKRAEQFEEGDAKFLSRWKLRTVGTDTYYSSTLRGYFNYGGITTVEVYLIKAECLARSGDVEGALNVVNTVREKRILASEYADVTAANLTEAMEIISQLKRNELILSIVPFSDIRRLNHEGLYTTTLSKIVDGQTLTLTPESHLWTMPFPQGAVDNPGNGSLEQNVDR